MTNEQAAIKLQNILNDDHYAWTPAHAEALRMAVEALKANDLVDESGGLVKDSQGDCISRQAVKDALTDKSLLEWEQLKKFYPMLEAVDELPSTQPERRSFSCGQENDLISRQAAIDAVETIGFDFSDSDLSAVELEEVCEAIGEVRQEWLQRIKRLPSAQLELRWIPVTEKLPEDEYVLISKKPTKLSGSKWCVTVAIRMADPRSGKIQWRDSGFGIIQDDEVLAWMPLPEPYREEGEEG